jgi:hypothetical protein
VIDPAHTCHCFYREDDHCFLGHPGPPAICTSHKAPTTVNSAPLDPEMAKKFLFKD